MSGQCLAVGNTSTDKLQIRTTCSSSGRRVRQSYTSGGATNNPPFPKIPIAARESRQVTASEYCTEGGELNKQLQCELRTKKTKSSFSYENTAQVFAQSILLKHKLCSELKRGHKKALLDGKPTRFLLLVVLHMLV